MVIRVVFLSSVSHVDGLCAVCMPWLIWRVRLSWWQQGPVRHLGGCLWPCEGAPDRCSGAPFMLFMWRRHSHREGRWSIVCFEPTAFPAPDLGGWPHVPCRWPGSTQSGCGQHSLRDVNKVYMWVLLCRQSEVDFSCIILIPTCPECLVSELGVLSHAEPGCSGAEAS